MSTAKLTKLWKATFEDGTVIKQPQNDHYSKHVDGAEHNPSSFRDILDKEKESPLLKFELDGTSVDLTTGEFTVNGTTFTINEQNHIPNRPKLIYFRETRQEFRVGEEEPFNVYINRYFIGWHEEGDNEKKYLIGL